MKHPFEVQDIAVISNWLDSGSINIFGMPFSGKDTQGQILADMFDGTLMGGGDILRNSEIPPSTKRAMQKGLLVPSEDYVDIVLPYLAQEEFAKQPLILSSVGRWHGEEEGVIEATRKSGHPLVAVIYLKITEEEVDSRWAKSQEKRSIGDRGYRHDDTPEILVTRLEEFKQKTLPVLDYYKNTDLYYEIDAAKPAVEVTADILNILYELADKDD